MQGARKQMSDAKSVTQKGGIGSKNTQIEKQINLYSGISYSDVKNLCISLIEKKLSEYRQEALAIAEERSNRLTETFLGKLAEEKMEYEKVIEEFKNPDMQYAFVAAQKSFIRTGTPDLEKILSDLLINRLKENNRSLLQIALSEAINVVSILLPEQMHILALCFAVSRTSWPIISHSDLIDYIKQAMMPHVVPLVNYKLKHTPLLKHLEYTRCGYRNLAMENIELIFLKSYPYIFLEGVNNNTMKPEKVKQKIINIYPESSILFDVWNNSELPSFDLTTVGIAIGASFFKQITGLQLNLSTWI